DIFTANQSVCDLIPRLKPQYQLVLASNTNRLHFGHYKGLFRDVLGHFDAVGVSFEAGARKPHPDFFAHCQRTAGTEQSSCLFIDDMLVNVEGAKQFGWHAIKYESPEDLASGLPDFGIDCKWP